MAERDAQCSIILPKSGAVLGIASIDQDHAFDVELWFAGRAAKGVETPRGAKGQHAGAVVQTPAKAERGRYGLFKLAMQVMILVRRDMLQTELMQSAAAGSPLALDFETLSQRPRRAVRAVRRAGGRRTRAGRHRRAGDDTGVNDNHDDAEGDERLDEAA